MGYNPTSQMRCPRLQTQVDTLKRLQAETAAELDTPEFVVRWREMWLRNTRTIPF